MILKHSYSLKLLCSKRLGPARLQHRAVQPEHSMSKAVGRLRNTQACKTQSIPLYCNIPRQQHRSLPRCAPLCTRPAPGKWEAGVRKGRNRWCPQGAKTTGCFRPLHPTTNQFGEGREKGVSVTQLSAWTDCPDHCPGSPVRSQWVERTGCWFCLSECYVLHTFLHAPKNRTVVEPHTICPQGLFLNPVYSKRTVPWCI